MYRNNTPTQMKVFPALKKKKKMANQCGFRKTPKKTSWFWRWPQAAAPPPKKSILLLKARETFFLSLFSLRFDVAGKGPEEPLSFYTWSGMSKWVNNFINVKPFSMRSASYALCDYWGIKITVNPLSCLLFI